MKNFFAFAISLALLISFAGCSLNKGDDILSTETTTELTDEKIYEVEVPFADTVSSFTFDENDRLLSYNNPGTNTDVVLVNYSYDSNGKCICISHYGSNDTVIAEERFTYNDKGFCVAKETYAYDDESEQLVIAFSFAYERDDQGRIIKITDEQGRTESYGYDANGFCISEKTVRSDGSLVAQAKFIYDENGRLLQADSTKADCMYKYDEQGRLIREVYELFEVEYEYFDDGAVLMYNVVPGEEKSSPAMKKEYFYNGKIIKNTWYDGTEVSEVNIFLASDAFGNEPDPTITVRYK